MNLLLVLQILVGVGLVSLILLQSQGTGLGRSFGGDSVSYHSKKGLEKYIFALTLILVVVFVLLSLVNVVV